MPVPAHPATLDAEPYWKAFLTTLEATVTRLPAHLIREEDMRTALRDAVLAHAPRYQDPWGYCPEDGDIDVVLNNPHGVTHRVELKLWHATLKRGARDGSIRSASGDEANSHVIDFAKQLYRSSVLRTPTWFMSLTQAQRHPLHGAQRWKGGMTGPFLPTDAARHNALHHWLSAVHALEPGATKALELPSYTTKRSRQGLAAPGARLRVRLAARAAWRSGGEPDWSCLFDFHAWEIRAADEGAP